MRGGSAPWTNSTVAPTVGFRAFSRLYSRRPMATRPPHGNLTAALVVVAALELVVNRLLGHLFATPTCHSIGSCMALRAGPFLLYLTGVLALIVVGGGIAGHLLRAAIASPALLLPVPPVWGRLAPALALAAGTGTFFFVASVGRPDLIQAIGLYSVHLELPRASSLLGVGYTLALFAYTVTLVSLLLPPGPSRLSGLGRALLGLGGYQTASPVELSLTLGGIVASGAV